MSFMNKILNGVDPIILLIYLFGFLCIVFPKLFANFLRIMMFLNFAFKESKKPLTEGDILLVRLFGFLILVLITLLLFRVL
jgi:hypothetical protein